MPLWLCHHDLVHCSLLPPPPRYVFLFKVIVYVCAPLQIRLLPVFGGLDLCVATCSEHSCHRAPSKSVPAPMINLQTVLRLLLSRPSSVFTSSCFHASSGPVLLFYCSVRYCLTDCDWDCDCMRQV